MRKLALGKGLRALLNGRAAAGRSGEPAAGSEGNGGESVSPGLSTLLRGETSAAEKPGTDTADSEPLRRSGQKRVLVKWVLLAGDVLLLSLVSLLVLKSSGPLSLLEWALCILSLVIGAALAWLALVDRPRHDAAKPSNHSRRFDS